MNFQFRHHSENIKKVYKYKKDLFHYALIKKINAYYSVNLLFFRKASFNEVQITKPFHLLSEYVHLNKNS